MTSAPVASRVGWLFLLPCAAPVYQVLQVPAMPFTVPELVVWNPAAAAQFMIARQCPQCCPICAIVALRGIPASVWC